MPRPDATGTEFTPGFTARIVEVACVRAGLDPTGYTLIRHHTNAVYRLAHEPVVVKINRPGSTAPARVVPLLGWLERHGIAAAPLRPVPGQPMVISGCPVTFWEYLPQDREVTTVDLAEPLAKLHAVREFTLRLPVHDPMDGVERSIDMSSILDDTQRAALYSWCERAKIELSDISYDHAPAVIHGDAQHRNALWHNIAGRAVLSDWDNCAFGQPEWDAITVEVHARRFGYPQYDYDRFCGALGWDVRDWNGYNTFRMIRELRMITTNARKSAPASPAAAEVLRRIDHGPETWHRL
ncbi:phosphotransferase [Nocardia uniformis]|uniref:Phosphotransferase n=2 Tax=Nocardia uniformis TaxID=53432 RepID=A0A849C4Z7_9NOCA|nr:phosphotransferase [Nocardia uniformis]NNH73702.1 phosphotransferase [Nocardia uniformis]